MGRTGDRTLLNDFALEQYFPYECLRARKQRSEVKIRIRLSGSQNANNVAEPIPEAVSGRGDQNQKQNFLKHAQSESYIVSVISLSNRSSALVACALKRAASRLISTHVPMGNDIAKQNQSVVGRHPFDVIDDNNLNLRFVRLELQPQLLLHGRKKIGRRKLWSFTCRLRGQRRVAEK